jgi:hypothetical protein
MIKIKLTYQHPNWPLLQQTPGLKGIWGNYQFYVNEDIDECDYWIVCDGLLKTESTMCPKENTVLITWEPPTVKTYSKKFLNQFATVITCQKEIKHKNIIYSQQAHPWLVGKNYDELSESSPIEKTKLLSIIVSNKTFTKMHRKRYDFALKLKEHFKDDIDFYGRGIKDFDNKWEVLAPYKYSIAIENLAIDDWLTEKLPDCYLAHTFPFYYGCPNLNKYYNEESFIRIDINDFEETIKIIKDTLNDSDHYRSHLENITTSREKYLNQHQLFPFIVNFIQSSNIINKSHQSEKITIIPDQRRQNFVSTSLGRVMKIKSFFHR